MVRPLSTARALLWRSFGAGLCCGDRKPQTSRANQGWPERLSLARGLINSCNPDLCRHALDTVLAALD